MKKRAAARDRKPVRQQNTGLRRCGLCGKNRRLMKTDCCDRWICDDEDSYVLFSFARNSCARNHRRFTLCAHHASEGHAGDWQTCAACRTAFETEMYVYYGTNEYNFTKLENPPAYEPTRCMTCQQIIRLGEGGYTRSSKGYSCSPCYSRANPEIKRLLR